MIPSRAFEPAPLGESRRLGEEDIPELGGALLARPSARYYTAHCAGERAHDVSRGARVERVEAIATGTVLEL